MSAAVTSCDSPGVHSASTMATGGAGASPVEAGASSTSHGGGEQLSQGGSALDRAGAGGTALGGTATAGTTTGGAPASGAPAGGGAGAPNGGVPRQPKFTKVRLNAAFYSEGINSADLDQDGKRDIIAGPYFYPGPDYTEQRAFRQPRATPFDSSGDSDCYSIFAYDLNQDGWLDILSSRLAGGAENVWYENPKGAAGYWMEHMAYSAVDNESATFADIDADGKPELVTLSGGYGGWAQPNWANATQPWTFRKVTANGDWPRYTHGLGLADVNSDGRIDLLLAEGWWEQPANAATLPWPSHPVAFWGQQLAGESYGGAQMFGDDVDGDGDTDVVTSLQAHGWGLAWFEQTGASFVKHQLVGTRAEEAKYGVAFAQPHALELADLDGDGLKDIVTGKRKGAHGNGLGAELDAPAVLYWFRLIREPGQAPRYEPHLLDSEAGVGTQVVVADVNGDGLPDILTAARAGAFLFLQQ